MLSAIGTAGNDGEKRGFGKHQTRVLHYWTCGGEENTHHLHVGSIFFVPSIFSDIYIV